MKTVFFFSGLHPILESIIKYPPEGYKILSNASCSDFNILKEYTYRNNLLKSTITKLYNLFEQPRLIYLTKKCDLIHTTSGVIPLNRKPFVVSVEYYSSFVGLQHDKAIMGNYWKNTKKYLSAENCKKIMPFSEASKKSIINAFKPSSSDFLDKLDVLYPAIKLNYCNRSFDHKKIRILHIGGGFFEKGGRELFQAVEIINNEYGFDIELCSITNAPSHYQEHFKKFINIYKNKKNFTIIENKLPRDILIRDYYSKADIFVLPSYGDFFGYVFLEAMSTGLPLIGTDVFAIPEIIEDGVNGFLVKAPMTPYKENYLRKNSEEVNNYLNKVVYGEFPDLVNDLVKKLLILIESPDIRYRMSLKNYDVVKKGKFSIIARNNKLKRIYNEALI